MQGEGRPRRELQGRRSFQKQGILLQERSKGLWARSQGGRNPPRDHPGTLTLHVNSVLLSSSSSQPPPLSPQRH